MLMVDRVHKILEEVIHPGDYAIDATVGNGWDMIKMCDLVGDSGKVYGFDIQMDAINRTYKKLDEYGYVDRAELFCCSHSEVGERIKNPIKAFTMNLGYLPGGDKSIVTCADTTVMALKSMLDLLQPGGVGAVLVYYGHEGGVAEKESVDAFVKNLPANWGEVLKIETVNRKNCPPILYILEKK